MRQHKLALCETHFVAWVQEQTRRSIEKYRLFAEDDRVLVAVSGGKDSLALWQILVTLGYRADGLYIDLGIDGEIGYSDRSRQCIQRFLHSFQPFAKLNILNLKDAYGESLTEIVRRTRRGRAKPCSICGLIKRHEMNRLAWELGYTVLATGHNLDDEVAVLWGNTLHWQVEYLTRQSPVLPADRPGFVKKAKPFCRLYERDTAAYALISGIDYIYEECPYSTGATSLYYKEIFNQMERHSPGTKLKFYLDFLRAKKNGLFPPSKVEALGSCKICGQPTISNGVCAFCRLWEKRTLPD
jgi:uncharacterized protein (TIGR00269 family)